MMWLQANDPYLGHAGLPIEISGERWIAQTAFWARAVGGVAVLAGGAVMLFADWNVVGWPSELGLALILGGPSVIYFMASFFVGKFEGTICLAIAVFAMVHAIAIAAGAIWAGSNDWRTLYLILAAALVAGLVNLIVSAFWARRGIREPIYSADGRRGYEVLAPGQPHSIRSDLEK